MIDQQKKRSCGVARRVGSLGLAAVVLSGGLVGLVTPAAHAAPISIVEETPPNPQRGNPADFWTKFTLSTGQTAFCVGDLQVPGALNAAVYDDADLTTYHEGYTAPGGTAHWTADAARLAGYIMAKYGANGDPKAVPYAVMTLANPTFPNPVDVGISPEVKGIAQGYIDDAKAHSIEAQDFALDPKITVNDKARTATVDLGASVKMDQEVTVTVTGATFKNGASELSVNAQDAGALELVIPEDAKAQDVTVTAVAAAPSTELHVLPDPEFQDLFIADQTREVKASASAKFTPVIPPKVHTVASDDVEVGGQIWDTLEVTGDVPQGAYATVQLYRLSDSTDQKKVLAGSPKCTEETLVDHRFARVEIPKAGTYATGKYTTVKPGTYAFVETLRDAEGKVLAQDECGVESETVVVRHSPKVQTVASDDVEVGGEIWDTLKVTGQTPKGAYATVQLHRLSDSTDQKKVLAGSPKCTKETLVDHDFGRIEVTGPGTYATGKFTTVKPGTYGFVETLRDAEGKVLAQGECGVESETVVVKPKPEQPKTEEPTPPAPEQPEKPEQPSPTPPAPEKPERKVIIHTGNDAHRIQAAGEQTQGNRGSAQLILGLGALALAGVGVVGLVVRKKRSS